MSMEERMTLCNMAIEGGAKMGSVQPDQTTFDYVAGRKYAPKHMDKAIDYWKQFYTDDDSAFDKVIDFDVSDLAPFVTWGTNPGMAVPVDQPFPEIKNDDDQKAYDYVGLKPGEKAPDIPIEFAFFGSCTNGRLSDLKIAADVLKGHHIAPQVTALVVPGSRTIKEKAEELGIDKIFKDAGCDWREPGCSACLGMNPDQVPLACIVRQLQTGTSKADRVLVPEPTLLAQPWWLTQPLTATLSISERKVSPNETHHNNHEYLSTVNEGKHRHRPTDSKAVFKEYFEGRLR